MLLGQVEEVLEAAAEGLQALPRPAVLLQDLVEGAVGLAVLLQDLVEGAVGLAVLLLEDLVEGAVGLAVLLLEDLVEGLLLSLL